jgi:hypothetical protein
MFTRKAITVATATWLIASQTHADQTAAGFVYHDLNANAARDAGEPGVPGVRVSNGRDVVVSRTDGRYEIPVSDECIVFVIKPRDWMTRVDELNLPTFWYVHKPGGSPAGLTFRGVAPTGPLPESIDFPLYQRPESSRFDVVVFGDPQPRDMREINYLAHDVVAEVVGVDAAFGVSLGDVMFDNLALYPQYNQVMSRIGIPWHNVHGNHDMNYDVDTDELADETWERVYGPATYAFDYGNAHFIAIDGVMYEGQQNERRYHGEFAHHLTFVENDLKHVATDKLVVLMMHIPLTSARDLAALFKRLENYPHTLSLAAHWHTQQHFFLGREDGWLRGEPHHMLVQATACGSWWSGAPDENGIPHTTMRDGAPNGYSILAIDGHDYSIRFKAARRPANHQMNIMLADEIRAAALSSTEVVVNVFAGSERSTVEMRIAERGEAWSSMRRDERPDPCYVAMTKLEEGEKPPPGRKLPKVKDSPHIWVANLPDGLPPGAYTLEVRTTDMFEQIDTDRRLFRVID